MKLQVENHNSALHINVKIAALVIVIFVGGIISGIALLQFTNTNGNNTSQDEEMKIKSSAIWIQSDWQYSQGAILIANEGNVAAKLREITVRGIECSWTDVYYWKGNIGTVTGELDPSANELSGSLVAIAVDGKEQTFQQATSEITLDAYQTMVLYIKNPGNITLQDVPSKVTIAVFTEREMYSQETGVNLTITFMGVPSVTLTSVSFNDGDAKTITVALKNTGTTSVTIVLAKVNNSAGTIISTTLAVDDTGSLTISGTAADWKAGNAYKMDLYDSSGQVDGSYQATAPS